MPVRLNGSTSGYTELNAPAVAGNNSLALPTGNGATDQVLGGGGTGQLAWVDRGRMVLETAKASTSGTNVDFTGIPSWVKRVTVMFNGVSTNGTSSYLIRLGSSGGVETTGYVASAFNYATDSSYTAGFGLMTTATAAVSFQGAVTISLMDSSANTWVSAGCINGSTGSGNQWSTSGSKSLSGTLDRIRITTVGGTDTFDAGSINILMEG